MSFKVEVWGDYACFTRPEFKTERVSYDVMTPSAARGLLEAIYWHPGICWAIDKIYVLNPIAFTNIKRNEVEATILTSKIRSAMTGSKESLYISTSDSRQQRATMMLKNVHYVIEAHFIITDKATPDDNEGKFCSIIKRRLQKGQYFHQPCFGCREFPANFRKWEGEKITTAYPTESKELGLMLYDMNYTDPENITLMLFKARLERGILNIPQKSSEEVLK